MRADGAWRLYDTNHQLLATIDADDSDFPWLHGRLIPEPAFDNVRPLFDRELTAMDSIDEDVDAWETAYQQVLRRGEPRLPHRPARTRVPPPYRRRPHLVAVERRAH